MYAEIRSVFMSIQVSFSSLYPAKGAICFGVFEGNFLTPFGQSLQKRTSGLLDALLNYTSFQGKVGQVESVLFQDPEEGTSHLIAVGLGSAAHNLTEPVACKIGAALFSCLEKLPHKTVYLCLDDLSPERVAQVAFGFLLRSWCFDKYQTTSKKNSAHSSCVSKLIIWTKNTQEAQELFENYQHVAQGVQRAQSLTMEPANTMNPQKMVDTIQTLTKLGVHVDILSKDDMEALGMHALLGVARGSDCPPFLGVMTWKGLPSETPPIAFVGKGVTFDSGGISLKPAAGMEEMKQDMAGAAAVIGLMETLALRKSPLHVVGVVALVENMPSGKAQCPGDIVTSLSGQTIAVLNTDAEGRLILADALWYTQQKFQPSCMIDLATLTGAVRVALGPVYAGLFSTDDALSQALIAAGEAVDEKLWRLPLHEDYDKAINNTLADVQNIGKPNFGAGSITAAQFLKRFVNNTPWAHIDIAATAMCSEGNALAPRGHVRGFGVQLLNRWLMTKEQV